MKEEKKTLEEALLKRFNQESLEPSQDLFQSIYQKAQRKKRQRYLIHTISIAAAVIALVVVFRFLFPLHTTPSGPSLDPISENQISPPSQKNESQNIIGPDIQTSKPIQDQKITENSGPVSPKTSSGPSPQKDSVSLLKEKPQAQSYYAQSNHSPYTLPDGSKVILKEKTRLNYFLSETQERVVEIEGEAFFEVVPAQSPFVVIGQHIRIEVLGTAFLVKSSASDPEDKVWVKEGKVKVSSRDTPSQIQTLTLGKQAIVSTQDVQTHLNPINAFSWVEDKLAFSNSPLAEVLAALEHHYEVQIEVEYPEILQCPFTGTFSEPKLAVIMQVLDAALQVTHTREGQVYTIWGKGCQP